MLGIPPNCPPSGPEMPRFFRCAAVLLAGLVLPSQALAWNRAGHMVSGAIAYNELRTRDPAALQRAIALLRAHPAYQARWLPLITERGMADHDITLFMYAARWPDDVRDEPQFDHPTWHYTNIPLVPPGDSTRPPAGIGGDVVIETAHNLSVLRDSEASDVEKAIALCWVLHLVGDLHQPLHAVSLYSSRWAQGDRGGNLIFVRATMASQPINLHSFWDGLIIGSDDVRATMNRAIALRAAHPSGPLASRIALLAPAGWARDEDLSLSARWAYLDGKLEGGTSRETATVLPESYAANAQRVAEERVTLAGYRLGALLARSVTPAETGDPRVPASLLGEFIDDYDNRYSITPTEWTQWPHGRFHIVRWDTTRHYLIAQNDSANSSAGGKWTRIDWVTLDRMAPFEWAFCLSAYDATTAAAAEAVTIARPETPRTGCNGFPFSRMRRPTGTDPAEVLDMRQTSAATATPSTTWFDVQHRPDISDACTPNTMSRCGVGSSSVSVVGSSRRRAATARS